MDWLASAQFWTPIVFFALLIFGRILLRRRELRRTVVCPTCGGAGRVRPDAAGAGRE